MTLLRYSTPSDDPKQNLNQVINSIQKTLGLLHQLYLTVSFSNVALQIPLLQRLNSLVVELDNMSKMAEKCNIQVGGSAEVNLIDDGKNPDEFTRDVINGCITKNKITKGKTDALKGLRKHLLEELEEAFPDEVESYREIRALSVALSHHISLCSYLVEMGICQEDDTISDDGDFIGHKASQYFEHLFGEFSASGDLQLGDLVQPSISDDDNMWLTSSPEMEEIKDNVFSMKSDSSPCLDGFKGKFFIYGWNIIKEDLKEAILGFFTGLQLPKSISSTNIVLVPKVNRASSLDQVRPISLCNFLHKRISKILNSRLSDLLSKLISPG
ncbi:hypothetical protein QQ045_000924 [Rhodiola kirilowii]